MDINKKRSINPQPRDPSLYLALGRGIDGGFLAVDFCGPELIFLLFGNLVHLACAPGFALDCIYKPWKRGRRRDCGPSDDCPKLGSKGEMFLTGL